MTWWLRIGLVCVLIPFSSSVASGECGAYTTSVLPALKAESSVIFSGVPTSSRSVYFGDVVTFAVDAVWQGEPGKQIALFHQTNIAGVIKLALNTRYAIVARPFSGRELPESRGLDEVQKATLARVQPEIQILPVISYCFSMEYADAVRYGLVRDLGPSHPPR